MPELPEVETIRTNLEPKLLGRRFEDVEILDSRLTRPVDPAEVAAELTGERVAAVDRRGKYLIVRFESGLVLLIHLRMTGKLAYSKNGASAAAPHLRAVVKLDDGSDVTYRDVRRFGTWLVLGPDELEPYLAARLGIEPLGPGFSGRDLSERLGRRRGPVKGVLLDQRTLAGVGNIYADEALWRARIDPRRPADELRPPEIGALHRGIRRALEAGIARQGATLRDYRTPDGKAGGMQHEFKVYGRGGEPCSRCGTPIEKTRVAGRGTWFCPACQR
ncbi:MAG: bifunctional DNA-formamidopyrimidine glycosylase/DNA-(apurinic or apyrimidinic site) lyase [Actinomycetota bacterium]|nr:bifunctional DNA-formamidopyrimidine glycosylase/DNA-(apurinic or apyrimidinic site) lyase [Actinomycetota bacterium]